MNLNNAAIVTMKKLVGTVAFASMLVVNATANAEVLTFDDLPNSMMDGSFIPNGYGGLQWNYFGHVDELYINETWYPGTGYDTGAVSGSVTAYNAGGLPASFSSETAFSLNSAFFTGAWNNGLQIHVVATGGSNTFTQDFTVDASGPVNIVFNWDNINFVSISSSGGTPAGSLHGGPIFVMDNLAINELVPSVSPVPEPETYAMLLAGLGIFGFMARRSKELN